jgi:c-di-GMP-related signal transduction protein
MRWAPGIYRLFAPDVIDGIFRTVAPPGVVLEIQESVPADEAVITICQGLKQADYMIALDNFMPGDAREPGYFFRHTEHLRARHIPANQGVYLRLLQAISKPEVDFAEIEDLIKREPCCATVCCGI